MYLRPSRPSHIPTNQHIQHICYEIQIGYINPLVFSNGSQLPCTNGVPVLKAPRLKRQESHTSGGSDEMMMEIQMDGDGWMTFSKNEDTSWFGWVFVGWLVVGLGFSWLVGCWLVGWLLLVGCCFLLVSLGETWPVWRECKSACYFGNQGKLMGSSWEKSLGTLVKLKDKFVFFLEVIVLVFGGTSKTHETPIWAWFTV